MRFQGKLSRDGKWWLAEVPVFDAMTQGRTRKEALDMIADWFVTMVDRKDFSVRIHSTGGNDFEVSSDDSRTMISLLLQRQRQKSRAHARPSGPATRREIPKRVCALRTRRLRADGGETR